MTCFKSKPLAILIMLFFLGCSIFTGCAGGSGGTQASPALSEQPPPSRQDAQASSGGESADSVSSGAPIEAEGASDGVEVRVGGLVGPTGMGMAALMEADDKGEGSVKYEFTLMDAPDKVPPKLINGELDIAALPVNMASILYNKTDKELQILAVNTLGVLHLLTNGEEVGSIADLKGKTIYSTGQGATPEYVLRYVLSQNGLDPESDVTIEFKSEHAELATLLAAGQAPIAVLPEPFVTTVTMQNSQIRVALDLTEEWEAVTGGAVQTTGCVVARREFVESHGDVVKTFLADYKKSAEFTVQNVDEAAELIEKYEIIAKADVARQAIPRCNIHYLDGGEMKAAVSKYLEVLYAANPQSVGGKLPDDAFYYRQ